MLLQGLCDRQRVRQQFCDGCNCDVGVLVCRLAAKHGTRPSLQLSTTCSTSWRQVRRAGTLVAYIGVDAPHDAHVHMLCHLLCLAGMCHGTGRLDTLCCPGHAVLGPWLPVPSLVLDCHCLVAWPIFVCQLGHESTTC
jgi:hypothetical protein